MAKASGKEKPQVRYYIGKKQYAPEKSDLLCVTASHLSGFRNSTSKLYQTAKGSFFLVTESYGKPYTNLPRPAPRYPTAPLYDYMEKAQLAPAFDYGNIWPARHQTEKDV